MARALSAGIWRVTDTRARSRVESLGAKNLGIILGIDTPSVRGTRAAVGRVVLSSLILLGKLSDVGRLLTGFLGRRRREVRRRMLMLQRKCR